ncbi:MAG: HIT domain-containing protein [Candidatus Saccharibacteria bacterium]|nr:HIT domain-containing protein [Candidatus Saccharibacteria bacterium]
MEESVFTKIVKGEIPCYKIYEDDKTLAFLDIHPETPGHTLVIPKVQVDKIYELPEEDYVALLDTARKLSANMEKVLGVRTLWKVIGTDVPHAHIHLMPFDETWTYGREVELLPEEMEELRARLALD